MSEASFYVVRARDPAAVRRILEALPEWFGDPTAIDYYVQAAADPNITSILAMSGPSVVGVALVRRLFPESAELHLIAVEPDRIRTGIGTALIHEIKTNLRMDGCRFLTVHTVGPSFDSAAYARTRDFYRSAGFYPLEEHVGLDWYGPTLILLRPI